MDAVTSQDQEALLAQLAQAREKLDGLVRDLHEIEGELEGLATERRQHRLLHDVCGALEELREIGGAALFWGDRTSAGTSEDHLRRVRGRVDAFQKLVNEIEDKHQGVLDEIQQQEANTYLLEEYLFEAQEQEERRKQEWIIEREMSVLPARALIMPWTRGGEEDKRFRKSLAVAVLYSFLFMLVIPHVVVPLPEVVEEPLEATTRLARLIAKLPPPPPPAREETVRKRPEEVPLLSEAPTEHTTKQQQGPGEGSGQGPGTGPAKGLLAFREKLSMATQQPLARLGSQARITTTGPADAGVVERAMITTLAPGSSGGINLAALSRGLTAGGSGGGQLAGVQVARVASAIGGAGTGANDGGGGAGKGTGSGGGPGLGRTDEEIQIVFDRYKSALYRLYNRELRNDPTLKGQVVLRMRIEPDGSVSVCELQGTDMRAPQLVAQVLERVKTFDFGAKDVAAVTILYPIDFLPAT